jgi:hypothetical protein
MAALNRIVARLIPACLEAAKALYQDALDFKLLGDDFLDPVFYTNQITLWFGKVQAFVFAGCARLGWRFANMGKSVFGLKARSGVVPYKFPLRDRMKACTLKHSGQRRQGCMV